MSEWTSPDGLARVINGEALATLKTMPDASVALIATDPPYFRVKQSDWDRAWKSEREFLEWTGTVLDECRRVLKPNGSIYWFASPQMAWGVEGEVRKRFNVLNTIRWVKDQGWHQKNDREELRQWLAPWEAIVFAEHPCASVEFESSADGAKATVFESVRQYLASERDRAGWTTRRVAEQYQKKTGSRTVTGMAGHWFERVQWELPTEENYRWLQNLFNHGGSAEYLRREYEDLRREFCARPDDEATDTWTFPTVAPYPGKHECEKPLDMARQIVRFSSRPGDTVLDCFAGSGVTGQAAVEQGRKVILVEQDPHWYAQAIRRIEGRKPEPRKTEKPCPLFDQLEAA